MPSQPLRLSQGVDTGRQTDKQTERYRTICFNFWPTTEKKMHRVFWRTDATEQHTDALGAALDTSTFITTQQRNMRAVLAISQWRIIHTQHVKGEEVEVRYISQGHSSVCFCLFVFCLFFFFFFFSRWCVVFIAPVFAPSRNSVACPKDSQRRQSETAYDG